MITRAKIEEMLKVAEKEYSSVMFLSDSKSFMKMKIAQAKIQLLTSLLAEDGGEVKSLPDDIREFIRIATLEIQSHRSKSDEQLDSLFQKAYQLYSKYNVEASQQAPSADTCTEDKHIKGCKCEAPSATVDEMLKEAEECIEKADNYRSIDYWRGTRDGIKRVMALHSQQPTVDDPYMKNFGVSSQQPTVEVEAIAEQITKCVRVLYEVGNTDRATIKKAIVNELTEALRGSYTREDMIRFRHFDCSDAVSGEQALRQYDTERGNSNGKV